MKNRNLYLDVGGLLIFCFGSSYSISISNLIVLENPGIKSNEWDIRAKCK